VRFRPAVEPLESRWVPSVTLASAYSLGEPGDDGGTSIATDSAGNYYVAGQFSGTIDLDPGPGQTLLTAVGSDMNDFIAKYSPSGTPLWAQRLGDEGPNLAGLGGIHVAVDAVANVYLTGPFAGTASFGGTTMTSLGTSDIFVAKLDPTGNFRWARQMGGNDQNYEEYGAAVAVDGAGNVYTTGTIAPQGIYVSRYDANGNLVWLKTMNGSAGYGHGWGIATDAAGNVVATGQYSGTVDFDPGPATYTLTSKSQAKNAGSSVDAFVVKLDTQGNFRWAGSMGGKGEDVGEDVAVDGGGNVYVTGRFEADSRNDFDPGKGTYTLDNAGNSDAFLVKLDANRNLLWAKSWGGAFWDGGYSLQLDAAGNVYVEGGFAGTMDADPGSATYSLNGSNAAGQATDSSFILKLTSSGTFVWAVATPVLGDADMSGGISDFAVDPAGNVYTTGIFAGAADFDPSTGTFTLTSVLGPGGNPYYNDAFVCELIQR
jgi:hypothetical protein